jgi:predicted secreted protein with PEFG-CTERM motif
MFKVHRRQIWVGIVVFVAIVALSPTVFGQNSQVITTGSSITSGGVQLGNIGISSVGHPSMYMINGTVSDGSRQVKIIYSPAAPVSGQPLSIALTFEDTSGNLIQHQNYAISIMQDGNVVFSNTTGHTHTGHDMQITNNLASSNPVDIQVTLNGDGLPGTDPSSWTGPKGTVLNFHIVPEFGQVASVVLLIAIVSVIIVSSKTRFLKL